IMWSFYIGGIMFIIAVVYTVVRSKEYPPTDPNWRQKLDAQHGSGISGAIKEITASVFNMPSQMKRLALVQFLTWPGLFLMWFYYSTGVARDIFRGDPQTSFEQYTKGVEVANATSSILNLVPFLISLTLSFCAAIVGT